MDKEVAMGFLTIDPATASPDLIYIGLIISLWMGVTAAYVPGTGIMEGIAVIGLVGSLIMLSQMPTNWLAALMIVIGVALFLVMPFLQQQYASMAIFGLVLQGIGSVSLFHDDISVSLFVVTLMLAIPLGYHQLVLLPIIKKIRDQPVADRDDLLVGMEGRVTKDIDPFGTVRVRSELWTATSDQLIPAGSRVVVVERNGLQLVVEEIKRKRREKVSEQEESE
jgi:membrane-bound serine protease (ClpP class)